MWWYTIYLSTRWSRFVFDELIAACSWLESHACTKIALPRDEVIHTDMLADYLGRVGVTHIGKCSNQDDRRTIYRRLWDSHPDPDGVRFRTVVTGYLDEDAVVRIKRMKRRPPARDIDIGYRAWRAHRLRRLLRHRPAASLRRAPPDPPATGRPQCRKDSVAAGPRWQIVRPTKTPSCNCSFGR